MILFVIALSLSQGDTCKSNIVLAGASKYDPISIHVGVNEDKVSRLHTKEIEFNYFRYVAKYYSTIEHIYNLDSLLIIHKIGNSYSVEKSMVIDTIRWSIDFLRYALDSVTICESKNLLVNRKDRSNIARVLRTERNYQLPTGWMFKDRKTTSYLVEVRMAGLKTLYHVCVEGLTDSHLSEFYELDNDSEWRLIELLFSR
jgi:hypothetical protein